MAKNPFRLPVGVAPGLAGPVTGKVKAFGGLAPVFVLHLHAISPRSLASARSKRREHRYGCRFVSAIDQA
jgi:hypothetical protein